MQTASGQAVKDNSNRTSGGSRGSRARRRRLSPTTMAILGLILIISIGVMLAVLLGYWPPQSADANASVAATWLKSTTATPAVQLASGLKIEKVGAPRHEGDTVTVTLKVTNQVMMPGPGPGKPTPAPGAPAAAPVQAKVFNGNIRLFFYNEEGGKQKIIGGGNGNVVNLNYGDTQTVDIVSTGIKDVTDNTRYEAFPDAVWTDKDPIKATPESGSTGATTPVPGATP